MIEASIILDPPQVPRTSQQARQLLDYLLRVLSKKAERDKDWMPPILWRERLVSGETRFTLSSRERPRVTFPEEMRQGQ